MLGHEIIRHTMTDQTYIPANADSLARMHTAEAVGTLVDVMRNAVKPAERLAAAQAVLDRGHGRAVQAIISVPARQAVALRLAGMSDAELMSIAKSGRGSAPEKGSPQALGARGGTMLAPTAHTRENDIVEGEFTEIDETDPCS